MDAQSFRLTKRTNPLHFHVHFIVTLFFITFSSGNALATWAAQISPATTVITDFAVAPSTPATLYATANGANQGIYYSTDFGASWFNQLANAYQGVAVDPTDAGIAVIGGSSSDVEYTSNDGGTWASATTSSGSHDEWVFSFSPSTSTTIYAGGFSGGSAGTAIKSTDSGENWSSSFTIDSDASPAVLSIAVDPTTSEVVYAGVKTDSGINDGLYKSVNGGTTWAKLPNLTITDVHALAIDPNDRFLVYAATNGIGGINRSRDGGETWEIVFDFISDVAGFTGVYSIAIDPDDSRIIYASGNGAVKAVVSTDCGETWTAVANGVLTVGAITKLIVNRGNDKVYALSAISNAIHTTDAVLDTSASGACPTGAAASVPASGSGGGSVPASGSGGGGGAITVDLMLLLGFALFVFGVRPRKTCKT